MEVHEVKRDNYEDERDGIFAKQNVIYFFYKQNDCLYVGEAGTCLRDRCFIHTPKESEQQWFKDSDKVIIIALDAPKFDNFSRRTLESLFITILRPKFNKEG